MTSHIFVNSPFHQCHGSTVSILSDGSIAVAWFAGTRESNPDTAIWWCRQRDGKWEKPKMMAKCGYIAHWNPVLHPIGDGTLLLYFKVGKSPDSWDTWKTRIDEDGNAYYRPRQMKSTDVDQGRMTPGPVRGKIVVTSSGAWIAPSSIEKVVGRSLVGWHVHSDVEWESVIHRSSNRGKTWKSFIVPCPRKAGEYGGIIQPSVWEVSSGRLAALFRSTNGILYRSDSSDDGRNWSQAVPTDIPNPNSAVDVSRMGDIVALVYNPTNGNWTRRSPLSVSFSGPDGTLFSDPVHMEDGAGNYSYPAMVATSDGFAVSYTWNRRTIAFARIVVGSDGKPVVKEGPEPYDFES